MTRAAATSQVRQAARHQIRNLALPLGPPPGVPRWVKMSGLIVIVLVLVAIGIMILGGGVDSVRHDTDWVGNPSNRLRYERPRAGFSGGLGF